MADALTGGAIVTGASRGIGRAIALSLAARRWGVVINYLSNREAAESAVAQVERAGGQALAVQADIKDPRQHQRLLDAAIDAFGDVSLLVNNAAMPPRNRADILETDEASYDEVMATNLRGPFFLSQLVSQRMIERQTKSPIDRPPGIIINIGSVSSYAATPARSAYCLAKAAMSMMTQLYAARLAEAGILVYEIRPGIIDTDMSRPAKDKYDRMIREEGLLPLARWGQPEDVAKAVGAIVDGALPYSTGAVIDVDGGFHIRRL